MTTWRYLEECNLERLELAWFTANTLWSPQGEHVWICQVVVPGDNAFLKDTKVKILTYDVWYIQISVLSSKCRHATQLPSTTGGERYIMLWACPCSKSKNDKCIWPACRPLLPYIQIYHAPWNTNCDWMQETQVGKLKMLAVFLFHKIKFQPYVVKCVVTAIALWYSIATPASGKRLSAQLDNNNTAHTEKKRVPNWANGFWDAEAFSRPLGSCKDLGTHFWQQVR